MLQDGRIGFLFSIGADKIFFSTTLRSAQEIIQPRRQGTIPPYASTALFSVRGSDNFDMPND